jgi:hypothetical protein
MYHPRVPPELPALNELDRPASNFAYRPSVILKVLRQTALKNRNNHLQRFYSIRAVAEHFHVPAATVSRIYRQLCQEKLLRTIWGSKTLLEAKPSRNGGCHSIGIPVDVNRFAEAGSYRAAVLSLQVEVWNHSITDHVLFFEQNSDEVIHLCIRNHHPIIQVMVWLYPESSQKHTLLRLQDLGIRTICLGDQMIRGVPLCYQISERSTIRAIVRRDILGL